MSTLVLDSRRKKDRRCFRDQKKKSLHTVGRARQPEVMRSEEMEEEIFPGVDNEITLTHIIPRLPWRTMLVLPSVCRDWKRALRRGHRDYLQRDCSYSTETLAVVGVTLSADSSNAIALYSVRDKRFYYVPPLQGLKGFPLSYQCVAMDGKLYVFVDSRPWLVGKDVCVLDLFGKRKWRQCASMRKPRYNFGCAVMDGKIYAFGGQNFRNEPVTGAEVYDPTLDSWSPIPYSGAARFQHRVTVVGEELVLHGGLEYKQLVIKYGMFKYGPFDTSSLLEFYNPVTKVYRVVDTSYFQAMNIVSGAQGIFHSVRWEDMCAHAVDERGTFARTHLRPFSADIVPRLHGARGEEVRALLEHSKSFTVTAIDDELLAVKQWIDTRTLDTGSYFVRSRGYNTENNSQMSWEEALRSGKHSSLVINGIKCSMRL